MHANQDRDTDKLTEPVQDKISLKDASTESKLL